MSDVIEALPNEEEYCIEQSELTLAEQAELDREFRALQEQEWLESQAELDREERESRYGAALEMCDLMARKKPSVRAYCPNFIYAGGITVLAADPKMGKTTFALRQAQAIASGSEFLGTDCSKANVLYATEQNRITYQEQADKFAPLRTQRGMFALTVERNHRISINDKDGKHELCRTKIRNWEDQIQFWREYLEKTRAKVLIIDTVLSFARTKNAESGDAGVISQLFFDLKELYHTMPELGIQALHHCRKEDQHKGGNHRERTFSDIAGSFGFRGGSDQNVIMYSERGELSRIRDIKIEGRFLGPKDPKELQIRLADDDGAMTLVPPLTWGTQAQDPQDVIRQAHVEDPELWKRSILKVAAELKVNKNQVEQFRKKHKPLSGPDA